MSCVAPKWQAHGVADWQELLLPTSDGSRILNEATCAVLNYMPLVGVTELKADNAADAWCRIAIHEALFGTAVVDVQNGRPAFVTLQDVLRHIGLETEGTACTFGEFCAGVYCRALRSKAPEAAGLVANEGRSLLEICGIAAAVRTTNGGSPT